MIYTEEGSIIMRKESGVYSPVLVERLPVGYDQNGHKTEILEKGGLIDKLV